MTRAGAPPGLTRRAVLGGVAAAGAVSLMRPAAELAAALGVHPRVFNRSLGSVAGETHELAAQDRFALVGVEWVGPASARIELRTRAHGGKWSRWVVASVLGHGPDGQLDAAPLFGEAIWTGSADHLQLRSSRALRGVRVHFISTAVSRIARAAAALPLARPVLNAGPGQPPIIARAAWAQDQAPPAVAPEYGTVRLAFVHHTENLNGYAAGEVPAMLLAIFDYHRYVRGWHDIGYNFVIDAFGRIWEAREGGIDEAVVGAQAGGYNTESTGVAVLGSFTSVAPARAAIEALERLLAWKLSLHGLPARGRVTVEVNPASAFYTPFPPGAHVSLPRIAGHRDGDSTSCPGDALYARLPSIRARVAALAGTPATATLTPPRGAAIAAAPAVVSGRLALLGGPAIAGAAIEVQKLTSGGASTPARATTAADGSWSAALTLTRNCRLRALHRAAPATVSDLLGIDVAPAIRLAADSSSPLHVSGTVFPAKRSAVVDLYALPGGHRRLLASKRVAVKRGRFSAKLPTRGPGRYLVRARTDADPGNVAGFSSTIAVSV